MLDPLLETRVREEVADWGSLSEAARVLGVSPQYLSQVLRGKCPPSDKLLASLGLERRIRRIPKRRLKQAK